MKVRGRSPDHLTESQELQLVALQRATERLGKTAVSTFDLQGLALPCDPGTIARLAARGLADSQVVRPRGGSQFTAYWLTPEGVERARHLQRAPNG